MHILFNINSKVCGLSKDLIEIIFCMLNFWSQYDDINYEMEIGKQCTILSDLCIKGSTFTNKSTEFMQEE